MKSPRLGVNIDHVATIRNARGEDYPSPLRAALLAQKFGANSITIHLREDRRHIRDLDLKNIRKKLKIPLNLEMAATNEMLGISLKYKPRYVCIVPEKRSELTTEGGLNLKKNLKVIKKIIKKLKKKNIRISLFIEPSIADIKIAKSIQADCIEIHTGKICNLYNKKKNIKRVHQSNVDAFIDDYAHTISAFIKLYEATRIKRYLDIARNLTEDSIKLFYNKEERLFNFNGKKNEELIANKIEIFDNVIPSSNSVMFNNLLLMGKYYNDKLYQNIYNEMSLKLKKFLNNYEYLSNWIYTNQINKIGINEIQVMSDEKNLNSFTKQINSWYAPNKIFSIESIENLKSNQKPSFVICRNYVCGKPIKNLKSLKNKIIQKLDS